MINGILGKKIGMTQIFDDKGEVHPVTVLQAGPCVITQIKRNSKDGYEAAQIGLVEFVKGKNVSKAMQGHFGKHDLPPVKFIREVAMVDGTEAAKAEEPTAEGEAAASNGDGIKVGAKVLVDIFNNEKFVDVVGVSKGRGFAGVVKRHHFGGGPGAHGHMFQVQGSIGASSFPSRVFPGMRMSGHMGVDQVTVRNLKIRGIDNERQFVAGGRRGTWTERRLCGDPEVQETAARAPWLCRIDHAGSIEGGKESCCW